MKRILFQGDSITDCGRVRDDDRHIGRGYALMVKGQLGVDYHGEYEFINRGIAGNRIVDLYARMKRDILNLKPDYMSILIGVNDVWHELDEGNGVDADKYEKIYCMLIEEIQEALPNVKIMILEPFCLKGTATDSTEEQPERWKVFDSEVRKRAEKARRVAEKYNLPFVELQSKFDEAIEKEEPVYWINDGVHPSTMGHELIKREWIKTFFSDLKGK